MKRRQRIYSVENKVLFAGILIKHLNVTVLKTLSDIIFDPKFYKSVKGADLSEIKITILHT